MWGEWLFIFTELGSTGNYFLGFGEQAHSLRGFMEPCKRLFKKSHLKEKAFISFDIFNSSASGGGSPPDPLGTSKSIYFHDYMINCVGIGD